MLEEGVCRNGAHDINHEVAALVRRDGAWEWASAQALASLASSVSDYLHHQHPDLVHLQLNYVALGLGINVCQDVHADST